MRDLKKTLTSSKSSKNTQSGRGRSFGYQILGFGSGSACGPRCITYDFFVAGGGGGGGTPEGGGGGGGGGVYTSYDNGGVSGITKNTDCGAISIQIGAGGAGGNPGTSGGTSITFKCEPSAVTIGGGGGGNIRGSNGAAAPNPLGGSGGGGGCYHHSPPGPSSGGAGSCFGNAGGGVPQRNDSTNGRFRGAGGGGVCAAGSTGGPAGPGAGGNGKVSSIEGSCKNYGCGGAGGDQHTNDSPGVGGRGDGGNPSRRTTGSPNNEKVATANQAGGGGGAPSPCAVKTGADGVVYLRFPTSCKPGAIAVTPGCNSIITTGGCTVLKFVVSGCVTFE